MREADKAFFDDLVEEYRKKLDGQIFTFAGVDLNELNEEQLKAVIVEMGGRERWIRSSAL